MSAIPRLQLPDSPAWRRLWERLLGPDEQIGADSFAGQDGADRGETDANLLDRQLSQPDHIAGGRTA